MRRSAEWHVLWLGESALTGAMGAALLALSHEAHPKSSIWTTPEAIAAWICFGLAVLGIIGAARGWWFPLAMRDRLAAKAHDAIGLPKPIEGLREVYRLTTFLRSEARRRPSYQQDKKLPWNKRKGREGSEIYVSAKTIVVGHFPHQRKYLPDDDFMMDELTANDGYPFPGQIAAAMGQLETSLETIIGEMHQSPNFITAPSSWRDTGVSSFSLLPGTSSFAVGVPEGTTQTAILLPPEQKNEES